MKKQFKRKTVSVIIPIYNEQMVLASCLESLHAQSFKPLEIIIVDDGSTDGSLKIAKKFKIKALNQSHLGPGPARNLGAKYAHGEILIFVDADMTFDKDFILNLTKPIILGKSIGTFSKNEMNANPQNPWSKCWNINRGWPLDRLIPLDYPDAAPVFRAILKSEFAKVGGFEATGEYTDDWSLSRKLGIKSTAAAGAIYYHSNPATLKEVYKQARWIGKDEFISGSLLRRIRSLILYSLPVSASVGLFKSVINLQPYFLIFKLAYDSAIWISVIFSFLGEFKAK